MSAIRGLWASFSAPQPAKRYNTLYAALLGIITGQGIYLYTRQMRRLLYTTVLLLLATLYACYAIYIDIIAHLDASNFEQVDNLTDMVQDAVKGGTMVGTIAVVNNLICTIDGLREISRAKKNAD